jgi:hypothetical protein
MSYPGVQYAGEQQTVPITVVATSPTTATATVTSGQIAGAPAAIGAGTKIQLALVNGIVVSSINGTQILDFCTQANWQDQFCGA